MLDSGKEGTGRDLMMRLAVGATHVFTNTVLESFFYYFSLMSTQTQKVLGAPKL